jgi:hypothetical protein
VFGIAWKAIGSVKIGWESVSLLSAILDSKLDGYLASFAKRLVVKAMGVGISAVRFI